MTPLVSVIMPSYNARVTLPMALASLVAQTHSNWECILVDDGSTDQSKQIIDLISDSRIRYYRFNENKGRGAARQFALDQAIGDYLCMLDADDWIYPHKLQRQLHYIETNPEIVLLSSGMAIVDHDDSIVGIRSGGALQNAITYIPPLKKPQLPLIAFAPSMIKMETARAIGFNSSYPIVEDTDFLLRIMLKYPVAILSEVTYVYSELASVNLNKITDALFYCRQMFMSYKAEFPVQTALLTASLVLKELLYRGGFSLGLSEYLVRHRSARPNGQRIEEFYAARDIVQLVIAKRISNSS